MSARNPLKRDETLIDYDMDSEEEWNEQNGEDVDNKQQDEDEDDEVEKLLKEEEEQEEPGFIVPDDYLSASEMNLSQSEANQEELQERRKELGKRYAKESVPQQLQTYVFTFHEHSTDKGMVSYFQAFKAVAFPYRFPLRVKEDNLGEGEKLQNSSSKQNPKSINLKLADLVRQMHGSFESKPKLIEEFNLRNPECSKKSIERKMRELFEKDKKEADPRARWYATESTLIELNLTEDQELKALFEERLRVVNEDISKCKLEQQKLKEEKKNLIIQQREQNNPSTLLTTTTPSKQSLPQMLQAIHDKAALKED